MLILILNLKNEIITIPTNLEQQLKPAPVDKLLLFLENIFYSLLNFLILSINFIFVYFIILEKIFYEIIISLMERQELEIISQDSLINRRNSNGVTSLDINDLMSRILSDFPEEELPKNEKPKAPNWYERFIKIPFERFIKIPFESILIKLGFLHEKKLFSPTEKKKLLEFLYLENQKSIKFALVDSNNFDIFLRTKVSPSFELAPNLILIDTDPEMQYLFENLDEEKNVFLIEFPEHKTFKELYTFLEENLDKIYAHIDKKELTIDELKVLKENLEKTKKLKSDDPIIYKIDLCIKIFKSNKKDLKLTSNVLNKSISVTTNNLDLSPKMKLTENREHIIAFLQFNVQSFYELEKQLKDLNNMLNFRRI